MPTITVYQFEYVDHATNTKKIAPDFATEVAIKQMGAHALPETGKEVAQGEVTVAGIWRPDRSRP